jgi:hypothetical protein
MATIDIGAATLGYDIEGDGPAWLVLLHEIGGTRETWAPGCACARRTLQGAAL